MTGYNIFSEIKQRTACDDLARELGFDVQSDGFILCPTHSEKTASCKVYNDGFYCYGCGWRGSCIDFVMLVRNYDLITSSKWLAERAGIRWPEQNEEARQTYEAQINKQQLTFALVKKWAMELRKEDIEYLKTRGFTEEFIKEHQFGYCSEREPRDAVKDLGLLTENGWYMPVGRITIPFFQYGRIVQVAFHKADAVPKYLYPVGWQKPLLLNTKRNEQPILSEGVFDYYSLLQSGLPSACSLGTQLSGRQKDELSRLESFIICFDADAAGRDSARKLAKEFYPKARAMELPEGKDLNDLLRELGVEKFRAFMLHATAGSKTYLDMTFDELVKDANNSEARKDALNCISKIETGVDRDIQIERLSKLLKSVGVSKTSIRKDIDSKCKASNATEAAGDDKPTQADILIAIGGQAELFHDEEKEPFAKFSINEHCEIWPLNSKFFKRWLRHQYFSENGKSPNSDAVTQAIGTLEGVACFQGEEHKLSLRVAEYNGAIWYDLADEKWRAIRITAKGWQILDEPPIIFKRYKNTALQVEPKRGGGLDLLKKYVNLKDESDWQLLFALIVHSFIPGVPHAIPVFYGDKGSAKTTAQRAIKKLIDPSIMDAMTLPTDKNELALTLMTNYAPIFDNLDGLQAWQSNLLCQSATGGGISKRELFTDADEIILTFRRCPMLNGINLVASKDDLLDRAVLFKLDRIEKDKRKTEKEFWDSFEIDRPFILGAILDVLSRALPLYANAEQVLKELPRMADFATWGYAIMQAATGSGDEFMAAYYRNIAGAVEEAITADIIGAAIVEFMHDKTEWSGTASDLLNHLNELPSTNDKEKGWPKRAHTLTRRINTIKSALSDYGIQADTNRTENMRNVSFRKYEKKASLASYRQKPSNSNGLDDDAWMTHDALDDASQKIASCQNPLQNQQNDANDANDGIISNFMEVEF